MCSVQDDVDEATSFAVREQPPSTSDGKILNLCRKCGEKAVVLLQRKDPMCRMCFEVYCNHKFRSTIGKSKKLKPSDKVLIAYSGGLCSSALYGLTEQALKDSSNKRLKFSPSFLYINESFIVNSNTEGKSELCTQLKESKYPVLLTSLEMSLRDSDDDEFYWRSESLECNKPESKELRCALMKSISTTKSLTTKLDYLKLLRTQLITDVAKHAGFNFVFCGDSCNDLAVELLCDIAMGRGSQISSDTSFYDTRYQVPICRPLREFLKRELAFYNHLNNIAYEEPQSLITKTDSRMSIQRLTESFVCGLQENFPATIHTIFKTGGKVCSISADAEQPRTCIMCKSGLDNLGPDLCSALELLSVSAKLSHSKETEKHCKTGQSNSLTSSCCCEGKVNVKRDQCCSVLNRDGNFMSYLCHGCQVTLGEMGLNSSQLPELLKCLKKQVNRLLMKEEIREFLLED